ncbi:MAG: hypothetical protein WCO10_02980 [bacterium]
MRSAEWKLYGVGVFLTAILFGVLFLGTEARAELDWAQALKSGPALRSYLEERSVQAYVGIDGEHVYQSSGNQVWTNVAKAAELREAVRNVRLKVSFDPAYPNFWTRVQYFDKDQNCTIYGIESVTALQKNGVWGIPTSVTLRVPNYTVALPISKDISDIWNAFVKIYDANGNLVGYRYCEVFTSESGQKYIRYPGWVTGDQLALNGQTAELQIIQPDGAGGYVTTVINPSTGEEKVTASQETSLNPMIEGREYMAPNQNIMATIPSTNSVGVNMLYQLPITQKVTVTVKAKTSEGEVSASFQYRRLKDDNYAGDTEWQTSPTGQKEFEPGVYDIWFEWQDFHEEVYRQMWDYYGWGKG